MRNGAPEAVRLTGDALTAMRHLIRTCDSAVEGYLAAASEVHDPALRSVFLDLVAERQRCCSELTDVVRSAGSVPPSDGTVVAMLHRRWMDIKHLVDRSSTAIINACSVGERAAEHEYRVALERDWQPAIRTMLARHHSLIERARHTLDGLLLERAERRTEEDELVERELAIARERWEVPPLT